jgi:uncharacterized protein (TIGR03086 family)
MSSPASAPAPLTGAALLERAVGYTRTSLRLVAGTDLSVATPCAGWSLLDLLVHMDDSLAAITEAAEIGYVDLVPVSPEPGVELVGRLRARACALVGAWTSHPGTGNALVADRSLRSDVLAAAGAVEIAVHGWDVARACGAHHPLPAALASELLEVVPWLVGPADRPARFGRPHAVPLHAGPGTRLLASLGRREGLADSQGSL